MSWLDEYKTRLQANSATNAGDYFSNATKINNISLFKGSPTYRLIQVDGVSTDVRVIQGKDEENVELLFLPDTSMTRGKTAEIDGLYWLLINVIGTDVFPKAKAKLCNSTFPLINTTKVLVGYDDFGKPAYTEADTVTYIPCIAETKMYAGSSDLSEAINLPENKIVITIAYTEHQTIKINQEFEIYDQFYKIIAIDKTKSDTVNKTGLFVIHAEMVVIST